MNYKTCVLIILMFFLTLSCAYASENQTVDTELLSVPADNVAASAPVDDEVLGASDTASSIEDLVIRNINFTGDSSNLHIQGFSQNGLNMSDFTMSIIPAADSSYVDLKMNIPSVSYTDYENTQLNFTNLQLSILPSSNPQTLEFSAIMDTLKLLTNSKYVNLEDLNLYFKSFPDQSLVLQINIADFLYG